MTCVAVMQPTFMPWLGYFGLIGSVNTFVFLDDVQFSKQSWQSRNQIKTKNGVHLFSLSVSRATSKPLIQDTKLASNGFERKLIKSLDFCLGKQKYYGLVRDLILNAFTEADGSLSVLNISLIRAICNLTRIGSSTRFMSSSDLNLVTTNKSERLLEISQSLGATKYLAPPGSFEYLDRDNPFLKSKVSLEFFNYVHPIYDQPFPPFITHMSAIEALSVVGPELFFELTMSGCNNPIPIEEMRRRLNERL